MPPLLRLTCAWMLVGLYAGGIFVLSSQSQPPVVPSWDLPHIDKLYHFVEYGGLTFVLIRALCLSCATRPSGALVWCGVVLAMGYGTLDEFHQSFIPDRTMSGYDLLADAIGASVVASVWLHIQRHRPVLAKP
jgi:VanZ family protein